MLRGSVNKPIPVWRASVYCGSFLFLLISSYAIHASDSSRSVTGMVSKYCVTCHDAELKKGGLDLDVLGGKDVAGQADVWERVVRKLRARQMPPAGKDRPDERTYDAIVSELG